VRACVRACVEIFDCLPAVKPNFFYIYLDGFQEKEII
jgi:hypothetical protein